jgi:hypothetical protein
MNSRMPAVLLVLATAFSPSGCASGNVNYAPPSFGAAPASNVKIIDAPRDSVWKASVPELSKQFFVINNVDKSSGLINISYSGDPEKYVNCGNIVSNVKNLRGARTYSFPGSRAHQQYEIMTGSNLYGVDRQVSLEGRMNLVFEDVAPNKTKVTANTRYVLSRRIITTRVGTDRSENYSDNASFNTGGSGTFPATSAGSTTCVPTGALETEALAAVK